MLNIADLSKRIPGCSTALCCFLPRPFLKPSDCPKWSGATEVNLYPFWTIICNPNLSTGHSCWVIFSMQPQSHKSFAAPWFQADALGITLIAFINIRWQFIIAWSEGDLNEVDWGRKMNPLNSTMKRARWNQGEKTCWFLLQIISVVLQCRVIYLYQWDASSPLQHDDQLWSFINDKSSAGERKFRIRWIVGERSNRTTRTIFGKGRISLGNWLSSSTGRCLSTSPLSAIKCEISF